MVGLSSGCSRKSVEVTPPPPEVLVTTVMPRDVAVVHEGVSTLEGFITANINAQVQGYIISRDYKEGNLLKKGDLLFELIPAPFEASLDQAKGNLAVAQSNQIEADARREACAKVVPAESPQRSGTRYLHQCCFINEGKCPSCGSRGQTG